MVRRWVAAAAFLFLLASTASATVSSTVTRQDYTAAGGTQVTFSFPVTSASQLEVFVGGIKQSTGYSVALNSSGANGGTVTFTSAPTVGHQIRVQRTLPLTQDTSLPTASPFKAKVIEASFDRLVWQTQQVDRRVADIETKQAADIALEQSARLAADTAIIAQIASTLSGLTSGAPGVIASASSVVAEGTVAARSLAKRAKDNGVNVLDFGAKCDGTTDDSANIQAALNYAGALSADGGRVNLPVGTCRACNLNLPNHVAFEGVSQWSSVLKVPDATTCQYMIRPTVMANNEAGYYTLKNFQIHGNAFMGGQFSQAGISMQGAYGGTTIDGIIIWQWTGTNAAVPAIWMGPGESGDGQAGTRLSNIWVLGVAPERTGVLVSSEYYAALGGNGFEGIVSNILLERVTVEGCGAQPCIKIHSTSENHVRAIRGDNIYLGGFTGPGLLLDGVTDSQFDLVLSEQGGAGPGEAVVKIQNTTASPAPVRGLEFHSIVSRSSLTPALKDLVAGYSPTDFNIVHYRTDGIDALGNATANRIPFTDSNRALSSSASLEFRDDIDRLRIEGNSDSAGGQVYLLDNWATPLAGRGGTMWFGGVYSTGLVTPYAQVKGAKVTGVNGDDQGKLNLTNYGWNGSTTAKVYNEGLMLEREAGGTPPYLPRLGAPIAGAPANSSAACTAGQIWADTGFIYVCTATNTIKRAAIATW